MDIIYDDIQTVLGASAGDYIDLNCGILKQVTQKDIRAATILAGLLNAAHGKVDIKWLMLVSGLVVNRAVEHCQGWGQETFYNPVGLFGDVFVTVPIEDNIKLALSVTGTSEKTFYELCGEYVKIASKVAAYEEEERQFSFACFRAICAYFARVKWWLDTITGTGLIQAS